MIRVSLVATLCLNLIGVTPGPSSSVLPEAAYVSSARYTNAFFGFFFPLPQERGFHIASVKSTRLERYLFALGGAQGNTTLVISAKQMNSGDADQLMRAAPVIWLHGKEFGKGISDEKTPEGGRVWKATYLTVIGSYLLEFNIQSRDSTVAKELEDCVEKIRFFDPAKARAVAGVESVPYNPAMLDHTAPR